MVSRFLKKDKARRAAASVKRCSKGLGCFPTSKTCGFRHRREPQVLSVCIYKRPACHNCQSLSKVVEYHSVQWYTWLSLLETNRQVFIFGGGTLLFHTFSSQEERRKFGGSDFFEIQFCRMPPKTEVGIITAVDSVNHWFDDSLYVSGDDDSAFLQEYDGIFDCGIYNNLETGTIDPYGINYYEPDLIDTIIAKLLNIRPTDYEKLVEWLNTAKKYNGFYILGV